ncbi:GumC family protein [Pannonibacter sp. SL95]|uniref:GumC family protein n=1 Tax=Pannonibacter sp. SL95 TaxID=2995153 RepID=UPI00227468C0|nr:GumC family protein [Pannonibacter sp. SL95]MCY1708948.1 GumC family protein [Pannonibacter sp. SL95]
MSSRHDIYEPQDMALDLAALMRALGRAQRWLLPLVLVVAASVFFGLQFVPEKFTGEAKVLIESSDALDPGVSRGPENIRALLDGEGITSQVQLLSSVDLARRVAQRLDLVSVPEFKASGSAGVLQQALALLGLASDPSRVSPEERVLKHYFRNLDVYRLEGSRVIAVEYVSQNPELAAQVANTVVDEYIQMQSLAKRQSQEVAAGALQPQIARLSQEVQVARKAVEDFRARADLLTGTDNRTLNQMQLSEISTEQSAAQAAAAEADAKARQLRQLLASGGSLESASEVLNSGLIQRLRERQVELQSRIAELSTTLLPGHPQLKALSSQLADYDQQLRGEARKILAGLENDALVAKQQAAALALRVDELKEAAARSNSDQVRLRELEREADAKAAQLDGLIASYRNTDTSLNAESLPADARVISRAGVPIEPSSPKVLVFTIAATLATFVLGCAIVVMREFLSGEALRPIQPVETYAAPVEVARPTVLDEDRDVSARLAPVASSLVDDSDDEDEADETLDEAPRNSAAVIDAPARPAPSASRDAVREARHSAHAPDIEDIEPAPSLREERSIRRALDQAARRIERLSESVAMPDLLRAATEPKPEPAAMSAAAKAAGAEDKRGARTSVREPARPATAPRRTVIVSAAEPDLSHQLAFDMARQSADDGEMSLLMEVFPDSDDPAAAAGFSDLVAADASFSSVIYRDAGSRAHIIEAGRLPLANADVDPRRFALVLDAIDATYDRIVIDLGRYRASAAAAEVLAYADEVIVASRNGVAAVRLAEVLDLISDQTEGDVIVRRVGGTSKAA